MIEIKSEDHFNKLLSRNNGNVVVLFTAPAWCGPCRRYEPHWKKADDSELLDDFLLATVDMGETREDTGSHWASKRFGILGVPQIIRFDTDWNAHPIKAHSVVSLIKDLTSGQ